MKYQCNICNTEYSSQSGLSHHTKSKHEGISFKCNLCKYSATQKGNLSRHFKTVHFKEEFPCNLCDYKATRNGYFKKHVRRVHQTMETIYCIKCNKDIKERSLKGHMKLHSETPTKYSCKICPYQTIHSYHNLKRHIEKVHMKK